MSSNRRMWSWPARGWAGIALAACAAWLLVQNALLLVWFSRDHLAPVFVVARALVKVGAHLVAELWMLPVAVMLGVVLALSSGGVNRGREDSREVSRV